MVRTMFARLLLISSFIIQTNPTTPVLAQATLAIYKVRLTGGGNAFLTGAANQWGRPRFHQQTKYLYTNQH